MLGIFLIGCADATGQSPEQQESASEAAAATATPVPAAPPEEPTAAPPDAPTPEAAAETAEEAPAGSGPEVRTFEIVPEQSEASYEVQEEFFDRPVELFDAVGRTNAIEGQFQLNIDGTQVQLADNHFIVDLRTLTSDESRRDRRIQEQWLESNTYPWAEFTATHIEDFPQDAAEGQDVSFKVVGDMTIREVTRPAAFDVTARLDGDTFSGTATSYLLMRDFGFEPPSIMGMLEVTDGVTVTLNFVAEETQG